MPARDHFHSVMRIGPVQIGTHRDRHGRTAHAAVCTASGSAQVLRPSASAGTFATTPPGFASGSTV